MADVAKAYVQIIPSAKGISGSISQAIGGEATNAGKSAGLNLAGAIKTAIAAAGIGTAIKASLDAGGDLQQSFGGLETIYGDAADAAKKYALQAAEAGISANDFAENAVSFGASLKQAYGGDMTKAVEAANTAILDMTDNSAKMGTDIGAIQTAYQGFAKQNYTMLDNLKLGYGGTKQEMQRLLKDATKLSGIEYNIDNLGDVYQAIHVIQEDLGLTGVAAAEASETFSGSFNAMKASATNLLAALSLGQDVTQPLQQLATSASAFLFNNLIPMVVNIVSSLPSVIMTTIQTVIPQLLQSGTSMIQGLIDGMNLGAPLLNEATVQTISNFLVGIVNNLPSILAKGMEMILTLVNGILAKLPDVLNAINTILQNVLSAFVANLPQMMRSGLDMIIKLVTGILAKLPDVLLAIGRIIMTILTALRDAYVSMKKEGINLLIELISGIGSKITDAANKIGEVIDAMIQKFIDNASKFLDQGKEAIAQVISGIGEKIESVKTKIGEVISAITGKFEEFDFGAVGKAILDGIAGGITSGLSIIADAAKKAAQAALDAAKGLLGIKSPSRVFRKEVGAMISEGMALGIEDKIGMVEDAMDVLDEMANDRMISSVGSIGNMSTYPSGIHNNGGFNQNITINSPEALMPSEIARQTRNATQQLALTLSGVI